MARPRKEGLEYFPLDVDFLADDKVRRLKGEFGLQGAAILIGLYAKIYKDNGYYMRWDSADDGALISEAIGGGCTPGMVDEVVQGCLRRFIFDSGVAKAFGVLTSAGIQRRFIKAAAERSQIYIIREYLLLDLALKKNAPEGILKKIVLTNSFPPENPSFPAEKPLLTGGLTPKEKNRIEKNRIEKKTAAPAAPAKADACVFVPPTTGEVVDYCEEKGYAFNAAEFVGHYGSVKWMVGRTMMADWRAAADAWEARQAQGGLKYKPDGQKGKGKKNGEADPWAEVLKGEGNAHG